MKFSPAGLITGIGSLPFTEPAPAMPLIFENMSQIPHWPQLPRRGGQEGFVYQFLNPLVDTGLLVMEGDKVFFDTENSAWPERLADFYTIYLKAEGGDEEALEKFALPSNAASGFYAFLDYVRAKSRDSSLYYKGHLTGPLTVGFQLKDARGRLAYYEEQLKDVLVKTLALHARWQAKKLSGLGKPAIIFMDEPGISVYGSSSYITITREMIINDLNPIFEQIHQVGAMAGVHSCDAIDWSILYACDLDIVNLDAYNFAQSLLPFAAGLKEYLGRGGVIAWGIVPTNDNAFAEDVRSLVKRLENIWGELGQRGIERRILLDQAMITPACGTGLLEPELAARIYGLAGQVGEAVKEMARQ